MNRLSHEARKQALFRFLYQEPVSILRRYRVPDYLGDEQLRAEVNDLVDDINSRIPDYYTDTDFQELRPKLHSAIRRRHGTQNWPSAKTFIAATNDAVTEINKIKAKRHVQPGSQEPTLDIYAVQAKRMNKGEPVSETYLWGRRAVELTQRTDIDEATIEAYRKSEYEDVLAEYTREYAERWLAEKKARHEAALRECEHGNGSETI